MQYELYMRRDINSDIRHIGSELANYCRTGLSLGHRGGETEELRKEN